MAMTAMMSSSDKDMQTPQTSSPGSSGSGSEGSDFVILSRPAEPNNLGSPGDFLLQSNFAAPFANHGGVPSAGNGGDISTMMNAEHLMAAFTGLKHENSMLKGQLTDMNKAMQSRIEEIQTMREHQNRMNKDLKDKHQKAKKAVTHYQDQNRNLSERLKELIEKETQNATRKESLQAEIGQLQTQLKDTQALPAPSLTTPSISITCPSAEDASSKTEQATSSANSPPSSLLTQMQEDLKNAQETRADIKRELVQMEEAGKESEEALQKANDTELQRLRQVVDRKDEEKRDLLKMNQELQHQLNEVQKSMEAGLRVGESRADQEMLQRRAQETASLPSQHSSEEGYIEEDQGFSLMNDSKEFTRPKEFDDTLLQELQNERERSSKLSEEVKQLRAKITKMEKDMEVTNHQLMETSISYEEERTEIQQRHKIEVEDLERKVDELSMAAQETRHNSGLELKQQVRSLVSEIQSREADIEDRNETINNLHEEIAALRSKVTMYHDDMEKDRDQNTQLINSLRAELQRNDRHIQSQATELHRQETMFRAEKQKALHETLEHDRLKDNHGRIKDEYEQLFADYDNLTRSYEELRVKNQQMQPMLARQREIETNQDAMMARLFSAEEAIRAKDEENQELKGDIQKMKLELETVPVLRAQAEVYKADFDAERAAREKAHSEKEVMMNEMETLRAECEQAQQEAANNTQTRVLEMQRRHGDAHNAVAGGGQLQGQAGYQGASMDAWGIYPDEVVHNNLYGNDQGGADARAADRERGQQQLQQPPPTLDRNVTCPKCMEQFPDMDSLQIHMLECIT